jgi:predicted lipoprotein with Yx(FWY)xxD motif
MFAMTLTTQSCRLTLAGVVVAVLAILVASASAGLISSLGVATRTINGKPVKIVVDRQGDTIYELSGETLGHLQCVTRTCLTQFTPVLVRSANVQVPVAAGVPGKATIFHRVKAGLYQLMLNNHPLYFYSGDMSIGSVNGQGLAGPGGSWRVVLAS